jgi:hypothetical protein
MGRLRTVLLWRSHVLPCRANPRNPQPDRPASSVDSKQPPGRATGYDCLVMRPFRHRLYVSGRGGVVYFRTVHFRATFEKALSSLLKLAPKATVIHTFSLRSQSLACSADTPSKGTSAKVERWTTRIGHRLRALSSSCAVTVMYLQNENLSGHQAGV